MFNRRPASIQRPGPWFVPGSLTRTFDDWPTLYYPRLTVPRILCVNPYGGIIGPNLSLRDLVHGLRGSAYEVHLCRSETDAVFDDFDGPTLTLSGVERLNFSSPKRLLFQVPKLSLSFARLLQYIRTQQIDLVLCNGEVNPIAAMAARAAGRPAFIQFRALSFLSRGGLARTYLKTLHRLGVRFIANSKATAAAMVAAGLPKSAITTIYNPIRSVAFAEACDPVPLRRELGISATAPLIGFVGLLMREKGASTLFQIVKLLIARFPDLRCLYVGGENTMGHDAPQRQALLDEVKALGLSDHILFTGYRTDLNRVYRSLDCFVHPSPSESFGRSLAEAMFCERAAVCFHIGALPELVVHGVTGYLIPPGNVEAFATCVAELLDNKALARQMGTAGRQRALEHFTQERHLTDMKHLFSEALQ